MKYFRPLLTSQLLAVLFSTAALVGVQNVHAQAPAVLENGYRNAFLETPIDTATGITAPVSGDLLEAYEAQGQNGTALGGYPINGYGTLQVNTQAPGTFSAAAVAYPASEASEESTFSVVLKSVIIGRPVVVAVQTYKFGGVIKPPEKLDETTGAVILNFYRAEPVNARLKTKITSATDLTPTGEAPVNAVLTDADGVIFDGGFFYFVAPNPQFYWSKHSRKVYATQPGAISIEWIETKSTTTVSKNYSIATSPDKPERTIFWTEGNFNGPVVEIPAARLSAVNIIYNSLVSKDVATPYAPWQEGLTDLTETDKAKQRFKTIYYDSNSIRAYNLEGRVFIEYLGSPSPNNDGTNEPKGTEIVNIVKERAPGTLVVDLGEVVGPEPIDTPVPLEAFVIAGQGLGQSYLHSHNSAGGTKTSLYAIRATEAGIEVAGKTRQVSSEVIIYWLETSLEGQLNLKWPKQYLGYVLQWPDESEKYSIYARPDAGSAVGLEAALSTAVQLDSANNPALVYQDDPSNSQAVLLPGNRFYTKVTDTDSTNRALLRFTRGEDIWFERILSKLEASFSGFGGNFVSASIDVTLDGNSEAPLTEPYVSLSVSDPNDPSRVFEDGVDYSVSNESGEDVLRSFYATYGDRVDLDFIPVSIDSTMTAVAVQPDGKILVGGIFSTIGGRARSKIARLNADGTLDADFNPGADNTVNFILVQPDGKILVGGHFAALGGQARSRIGRLNADGSLDADFDPIATPHWVQHMVLQPDGKILVAGYYSDIAGQARNSLARLNADGTLDEGFNALSNSAVNSIVLQPDGKIVVAGYFTTLGGQSRLRIGRLNADGSLDLGFNPRANGVVWSLALQPDGKILVGGDFTFLGGQDRQQIARLNANGTLDTDFNPGTNAQVRSFFVQPDGKILVGGSFQTIGGQSQGKLGRLNASGTLDSDFNLEVNGNVFSLAAQPDGKILMGGSFTSVGGQARSRLARLTGDSLLPSTVTVNYSTAANADIGERLTPLGAAPYASYGDDAVYVGYIHPRTGTAFDVDAYIDPFVAGFDEAVKGSIIGVNALTGNDELEVWWYRKSEPKSTAITPTLWPSFVQKYKLRWPDTPPKIVLANNLGSGDLPNGQATTGTIYTQNDPELPGYNPNEEHALMINGRAWALRDDLNQTDSSEPYVLLQYTDTDQRPSMRIFKIERGDFTYEAIAGKILQSPMPMPLLLPPLFGDDLASYEILGDNVESPVSSNLRTTDGAFVHYEKFTWTDRKKSIWVYRGPHAGNTTDPAPTLKVRYFYNTLAGFNFPSLGVNEQPEIGTVTPYLRNGTPGNYVGNGVYGISGVGESAERGDQPLEVTFEPQWPQTAPELRVGETLTLAKLGLPSVRGQASSEIIYQQSVALAPSSEEMVSRQKSARLFDPTRAKVYPLGNIAATNAALRSNLSKIPDSINTSIFLGKTYFPNLPPHLSGRLYFDPAVGPYGSLVFKGLFMDELVGEKYLQLNVMSAADITDAKALVSTEAVDKDDWYSAIDGLVTTMQTFIEDPSKKGTFKVLTDEAKTPRLPVVIDGNPFTASAGTLPLISTANVGSQVEVNQRPPVNPEELADVFYSDTAVDSYALSASGGGKGYVVLAMGNGENPDFTPADQPVSLQVFKVNAPLYRGELKVINSSNPLDEKLTLQHTGDFAGHPEEYDFEWRYAPPVDGLPPKLYSYMRQLVTTDSSIGDWLLFPNPVSDALDSKKDYQTYRSISADLTAGTEVTIPGQLEINDGEGTAANGTSLPNAILRRTFSATERPLRLFLSLDLAANDGASVYLNGAPVAALRVPGRDDTGTATVPATAPAFDPLPHVFEIDSNALVANGTADNNVLTVELYTTSDAGSLSFFSLRLEGSKEVENLNRWLPVGLGTDTASSLTISGITSVQGKNRHTIQGSSILTLSDNWITMRYRARDENNAAHVPIVDGAGWSKWTEPQLAEGWIKRVLAGINPFQQRIKDLFSHETNTSVSLVEQAGKRWEGDIALNLENINDSGLIEIYETVLRRGKDLSISGTPAINYGGANDALLLAAGYLSDLYMILGNEAAADAANSTIAFSTDSAANFITQYGDVATSLFAFKGQLSSVLDEELSLLRGRDDSLLPGTAKTPIYNRLIWNYTRGIDAGEAIYALNYNIKDVEWDYSINPNNPADLPTDGVISAADAAIAYPQGHGDAYGHYLTALTGYYGLLNNENFTWTPRIEAVLVLGTPVSVDYQDERKFASAAAAVARTASQTLDLTYRQQFSASDDAGWSDLHDTKGNPNTGQTRHWGTDDWASRGGQGALFNWITANSLLPSVDPDPSHSGIQKIDRTTVPELSEIVAQAAAIQQTLDDADAQLNPLGISAGGLSFDISPTDVDAGKTHYEQIYERAIGALQNAVSAFNNAKGSTQFLRQQEDTLADQRNAIESQEQAFTNRLIELYGTPYTDDIGPGKTYKQGYEGPDLLHSTYVDLPEVFKDDGAQTSYTLLLDPSFVSDNSTTLNFDQNGDGVIDTTDSEGKAIALTATYTLNARGQVEKPELWTGRRVSPGRVQTAMSDLLLARLAAQDALGTFEALEQTLRRHIDHYVAALNATGDVNGLGISNLAKVSAAISAKAALRTKLLTIKAAKEADEALTMASIDGLPRSAGIAFDPSFAARAFAWIKGGVASVLSLGIEGAAEISIEALDDVIERLNFTYSQGVELQSFENENRQLLFDLHSTALELKDNSTAVDASIRHLDQARRDLYALQAEGDRIQKERLVFRQHAAAIIQGYRTRDFAFRAFRDEALERYKALFDLSARYTYLAARAYDYETGLIDPNGNASAADFYEKIVKARALGVVSDGQPQFAGSSAGDPGLSGVLAEMAGDWSVVKSRLGFNNPDRYRTTFSLREENFRLIPGTEGDAEWRRELESRKLNNILDDPDVRRHAMRAGNPDAFAVPGIVLEFSTTIEDGYNFFGKPLAAGDHGFSPTSFATKIRSSGVAFKGYQGMDDPTSLGGALGGIGATSPSDPSLGFNGPNGLSATPYIYLIPAGTDMMRSPPLGDTDTVRAWTVLDQAIPLPFNIADSDYSTQPAWVSAASLSEPAFMLRKHQAFRAVPSGTVFSSSPGFTNSRLIGRSVWNTRWKIVIPGNTLLNDSNEGLKIFLDTVKDIELHLETYSYSGN